MTDSECPVRKRLMTSQYPERNVDVGRAVSGCRIAFHHGRPLSRCAALPVSAFLGGERASVECPSSVSRADELLVAVSEEQTWFDGSRWLGYCWSARLFAPITVAMPVSVALGICGSPLVSWVSYRSGSGRRRRNLLRFSLGDDLGWFSIGG